MKAFLLQMRTISAGGWCSCDGLFASDEDLECSCNGRFACGEDGGVSRVVAERRLRVAVRDVSAALEQQHAARGESVTLHAMPMLSAPQYNEGKA